MTNHFFLIIIPFTLTGEKYKNHSKLAIVHTGEKSQTLKLCLIIIEIWCVVILRYISGPDQLQETCPCGCQSSRYHPPNFRARTHVDGHQSRGQSCPHWKRTARIDHWGQADRVIFSPICKIFCGNLNGGWKFVIILLGKLPLPSTPSSTRRDSMMGQKKRKSCSASTLPLVKRGVPWHRL